MMTTAAVVTITTSIMSMNTITMMAIAAVAMIIMSTNMNTKNMNMGMNTITMMATVAVAMITTNIMNIMSMKIMSITITHLVRKNRFLFWKISDVLTVLLKWNVALTN